jgi:hypothetical protein
MGAQGNGNPVVNIGPLGVVVHLLGNHGYPRHKAERFCEVLENECLGKFSGFFSPVHLLLFDRLTKIKVNPKGAKMNCPVSELTERGSYQT